MANALDNKPGERRQMAPDPIGRREEPPRRPEDVLKNIKLALVTAELSLEEPKRGFDPYNSKLGRSPRNVWDGRRRPA